MKVTVDGIEIDIEAGKTVLQAAAKVSKQIPHFCYHPGLPIVGQCRMCFVEVEGMPKLATACSTLVAEGMKVKTDSEKVRAGQNGTLEFILLNHPLDCPICDRGGECKLQDYTFEYGPPRSRMVEEKILKDKHRPVSAQVVLDQERCILCTRCIRFSADVDGRGELVVNQRGSNSVVDIFEDTPMKSNFSGNVVDICPVGALTAQDFRFQARPWELRTHDALCTGCSMGCNITIDTKHRHPGIERPDHLKPIPQIMRLMPRENLKVNTWWMCDAGRWGYHFHNEDTERLISPMAKRRAGEDAASMSLREIQLIIDERTKGFAGQWEFWIDDSFPHEGIAWAKELRTSWTERGRKVGVLNDTPFAKKFLESWARFSKSPWFAGEAEWKGITQVVSTLDNVRALETIVPILGLKLGQAVRHGQVKWVKRDLEKMSDAKDDLEKTAYLLPIVTTEENLKAFAKIPENAKVIYLWKSINARGLLNEGVVPIEALSSELAQSKAKGPVFFFTQKTQNAMLPALQTYLANANFLIVADSFRNSLTTKADVVLPLTPLYESTATFTNIDNVRQLSRGIHLNHPNTPSIHRGDNLVSPSLRLL